MATVTDVVSAARALKEMLTRFDGVDTGYCKLCGRHRWFVKRGKRMVPEKCTYRDCPSRRWWAAYKEAKRRNT